MGINLKSYTSVEQSRKLANILPIETADAIYPWRELIKDYDSVYVLEDMSDIREDDIPCWSLAALLEVMTKSIRGTTAFDEEEGWLPFFFYPRLLLTGKQMWQCVYKEYNGGGASKCLTIGESPIDACYEMILKLHEEKML